MTARTDAGPTPGTLQDDATARPVSAALIATVVMLTAIAPLATDMYVPAFPDVARDLGTSATAVQLTLTTFFTGMALASWPVDRSRTSAAGAPRCWPPWPSSWWPPWRARWRRPSFSWPRPVSCRASPALGHGHRPRRRRRPRPGPQLVRSLNLVQGVGGIAPIVAPLLGGIVLQLSDWRAPFWVIAVITTVTAVVVWFVVPESLPPHRRHAGGLRAFAGAAREVLGNRSYVGYLLVCSAMMVALFAYVATSAFVLRSMNGLSPIAYSVSFATNAVGMTLAALVSARLAGRVRTRTVIVVGQVLALAAGLGLLVGALWFGTPLCSPSSASSPSWWPSPDHRERRCAGQRRCPRPPGTGSAVLGMLQWGTAGSPRRWPASAGSTPPSPSRCS